MGTLLQLVRKARAEIADAPKWVHLGVVDCENREALEAEIALRLAGAKASGKFRDGDNALVWIVVDDTTYSQAGFELKKIPSQIESMNNPDFNGASKQTYRIIGEP